MLLVILTYILLTTTTLHAMENGQYQLTYKQELETAQCYEWGLKWLQKNDPQDYAFYSKIKLSVDRWSKAEGTLHVAVKHKKGPEECKRLMQLGANPLHKNKDGISALALAASKYQKANTEVMIEFLDYLDIFKAKKSTTQVFRNKKNSPWLKEQFDKRKQQWLKKQVKENIAIESEEQNLAINLLTKGQVDNIKSCLKKTFAQLSAKNKSKCKRVSFQLAEQE